MSVNQGLNAETIEYEDTATVHTVNGTISKPTGSVIECVRTDTDNTLDTGDVTSGVMFTFDVTGVSTTGVDTWNTVGVITMDALMAYQTRMPKSILVRLGRPSLTQPDETEIRLIRANGTIDLAYVQATGGVPTGGDTYSMTLDPTDWPNITDLILVQARSRHAIRFIQFNY